MLYTWTSPITYAKGNSSRQLIWISFVNEIFKRHCGRIWQNSQLFLIVTKGARGSLACEKAVHIAQAVRERWHTPRFFPVRSRAHFRVFSRLALLASLVVGLTFTVEVTLNKLLKDRGVLESRDCD